LEAQKVGRNPDQIELSCPYPGPPTLDAAKTLQDLGVDRMVVAPPAFDAEGLTRGLEQIGDEVISRV
jgi:hypothetical protein